MDKIKVLIVDDVEANRISLQYLLDEYFNNLEIIMASSGEDALKIAYQKELDIIILDIQMPGMDGFETAQYLKKNPKTADVPVIFLTAAYKENEFQKQGFAVGAVDYLTKPIEDNQLINKLRLYFEIFKKNQLLKSINNDLEEKLKAEKELQRQLQLQQEKLIEQSKMAALGEMLGNIAHQWRQPLSVISVTTSGMKLQHEMDMLNDELFNNYVNTIMNSTEYLSKTIEVFRNFIQKDSELVTFDLKEYVTQALDIESSVLMEHNITVINNLEEEITIKSYPNALLQCITSILNNAKDAFETNNCSLKFIFIELKKEDEYAILNITDSAGGIPENILTKIFEPYFTTKHQSQGTGLGLHMVYKIVTEGMRGTIIAENQEFSHENQALKGARLSIKLPLSLS